MSDTAARRAFWGEPLWQKLLALTFLAAVLALIFWPVFAGDRRRQRTPTCMSNVKQLWLGCSLYAAENDARLPAAAVWMDAIEPGYVKNEKVLHCPGIAPFDPKAYGYAMNFELSRRLIEGSPQPEKTPLIFDSILTVRNACSGYYGFPDPPRHGSANVTVDLDGHARAPRP